MRWILSLFVAASTLGCAATPLVRATPVQADGQDETFRNGTPFLSSRGARFDVTVAPKGGPTGRYSLEPRIPYFVFVRNRSDARIRVSERSIRVQARAFGRHAEVNVLSASEIEDKIRLDAAWAQAAVGFAAAASAMSSALSPPGTTYHSLQVGGVSGSGVSYSPDVARQERRQQTAEASAAAEKIAGNERAALSRVSELLQMNTLEPGDSVSGAIMLARRRPNRVHADH
jgi:hypothetical protein